MSLPAVAITGLAKRYGTGAAAVDALKHVDMQVAAGEVVGLIGPSGSGKSTLLKCLGAVVEPTAGRIDLGGDTVYDGHWRASDLRALRRDRIGFVFQAPYLIPFLDVTDNVALLPMLAGVPNRTARERAHAMLEALDVAHRAHARVAELSGGHLKWTDGMLYPVLHRLERQGHVATRWGESETGRKRKYYRITRSGRQQLATHQQQWQVVDDTLRGLWAKA